MSSPEEAPRPTAERARRRRIAWFAGLAALVLIGLWLNPTGSRLTRSSMAVLAVGLWVALAMLGWRFRWARLAVSLPVIILAVVAGGPLREHAPARLRERFVTALRSYEGTRYVWGGETGLGIDCSGLVRRALSDAYVHEALATADLGLLRESLLLRWFDTSAAGLLREHRQQTRRLYGARNVHELLAAPLFPGDFVVTADGVHVMAFVGGTTWIAADPDAGRVITLQPGDSNPWLRVPVAVMAWRALEGQRP